MFCCHSWALLLADGWESFEPVTERNDLCFRVPLSARASPSFSNGKLELRKKMSSVKTLGIKTGG